MRLENPPEKKLDWQTQMVCHVNPNNNPRNDYYGHNECICEAHDFRSDHLLENHVHHKTTSTFVKKRNI